MRNELITFRNSVLAGMLSLVAASCSDDAGTDNRLPEGKYPITFTAAVDGLTVTRATSEGSWTKGDKVAIQIDEVVKQYEADADDNLSAIDENNVFYWQNTDNITVNAWYPYNGGTKPDVVVKANQNEEGNYQASDYLEVEEDAIVTFQEPKLTFYHRTAKVSVTLKESESVPDVSGATVTFINQAGVEGDGTEVIPKKETADGNVTTYTALLVPQKMDGKQFIKVTIGEGDFVRDYVYTPEEGDADLEAGKLYTYNITVKKTGLEVTAGKSVSWDEASVDVSLDDNFVYQITAPTTGVTIAAASGGTLSPGDNGFYTLSGGHEITVTVNEQKDKFLKGLSAEGIYDRSVDYQPGTYTYTYELKSDIFLSEPVFVDRTEPEVGNFYYFDGTWSADLWDKTCVGIVFRVGVGKDDNIDNYSGSGLIGEINGYVVALNMLTDRRGWGEIDRVNINTDNNTFYGYHNTQIIKNTSGYGESTFWACYHAEMHTPAAPANSSGWYLPSLGEYNALWQSYSTIKDKFKSAGGMDMEWVYGTYWTSSKKDDSAACVYFGAWNAEKIFTDAITTSSYGAYVRPVLTF